MNTIVAILVAAGISLSGSLQYFDSAIVSFEPVAEEVTSEELRGAAETVRIRLDAAGLVEAEVRVNGETIEVIIPDEEMKEAAIKAVEEKATVEFKDADGNVVIDASDIEKAEVMFGRTSEFNNNEYYVQIFFTREGRANFKAATKAATEGADEGKDYISIVFNGVVVSQPKVEMEIDSDNCIVSGNLTKETAEQIAFVINSGNMPVELKVVE